MIRRVVDAALFGALAAFFATLILDFAPRVASALPPGGSFVEGFLGAGSTTQPNPILFGTWDGTTLRALSSDASGQLNANVKSAPTGASSTTVQGAGAAGAATVGNPVLEAGSDGANARAMLVDSSGRQQVVGAAAAGAAIAGNPVLEGGSDGANARALLVDTSGRQIAVGAAAAGAAVAGNPVLTGRKDGAGNAQSARSDTNGVTLVSPGINALVDTVTLVAQTTSNGATFVTIGPAASASNKVFVGKLIFYNVSTAADHTVTLRSSGGTQFFEFTLAKGTTARNGGNFVLDNDAGWIQSASGEALQFAIDTAAGATTDVKCSGVVVQKTLN